MDISQAPRRVPGIYEHSIHFCWKLLNKRTVRIHNLARKEKLLTKQYGFIHWKRDLHNVPWEPKRREEPGKVQGKLLLGGHKWEGQEFAIKVKSTVSWENSRIPYHCTEIICLNHLSVTSIQYRAWHTAPFNTGLLKWTIPEREKSQEWSYISGERSEKKQSEK